jgi:hypothetical protein
MEAAPIFLIADISPIARRSWSLTVADQLPQAMKASNFDLFVLHGNQLIPLKL